MVGVPVVAAPTDEEAAFLATSAQQKILALMRGQSLKLQPPVNDMDARWDPAERHSVEAFLGVAVVGGPERVGAGLSDLVERTQADELMLVTDIYDPALRLRSCDIVASVCKS